MDVREQILGQAERLFFQFGHKKTTVADIAQACGISKGSIYSHFQSKDDILLQAVNQRLGRIMDHLRSDLAGPGRPEEKLKSGLFAMLAPEIDRRRQAHTGVMEIDTELVLRIIAVHDETRSKLMEVLDETLQDCRRNGRLNLDVAQACWLIAETANIILLRSSIDLNFDWRLYLDRFLISLTNSQRQLEQ